MHLFGDCTGNATKGHDLIQIKGIGLYWMYLGGWEKTDISELRKDFTHNFL